MEKEKRKKYSPEYISYVERGDSAAVFITRDIVNSIDTRKKWIDVVEINAFDYYDEEDNARKDFNYFIVELFPRITTPDYSNVADEEDRKYITWKTAIDDITVQRAKGYVGPKFLILARLWKKRVLKGTEMALYNKAEHRFLPGLKQYPNALTEYRKKKIYEIEYTYSIKAVKTLSKNEYDYIEKNINQIDNLIDKNKKVDLSYFNVTVNKKKNSNKK